MLKKVLWQKTSSTHIQFVRYIIVGGTATVVDWGTLYTATEFLQIHYLLSNILAFTLGLTTNYLLSRAWIFESKFSPKKEFAIFTLVGIAGLGLNEIIMYTGVEILEFWYMYTKVLATIIVLIWNFALRKKLAFK